MTRPYAYAILLQNGHEIGRHRMAEKIKNIKRILVGVDDSDDAQLPVRDRIETLNTDAILPKTANGKSISITRKT